MSACCGNDEDGPLHGRSDLAEFERELRRVLERRLVQTAQSPTDPTPDEAAQLARMAAHMEASDLAQRPRALGQLPESRRVAHTAAALADRRIAVGRVVPFQGQARDGEASGGLPTGAAPVAAARSRRQQRTALLLTYAALAATVLGVVLVRGVVAGPNPGAPRAVDLTARGTSPEGARPTDDVYLGAESGAGAASTAFTGRVTWDPRGQDGVVRVAVFDRSGDPGLAVSEELVEGSAWTPKGPLPKRFRVVVDRPADDGVSREELHCADYFVP